MQPGGPRFGDACSELNQTLSQYSGLLSFLYVTWITVVHCTVHLMKSEGERLTISAVKYASLLSAGPTLSRRSDVYDELCAHITPCEQIVESFACLYSFLCVSEYFAPESI
jgi:hypothetical protein